MVKSGRGLSLGSHGWCYLLLVSMTILEYCQPELTRVWGPKFILWFSHILPTWLTLSFHPIPEVSLIHLVSSSSGGQN